MHERGIRETKSGLFNQFHQLWNESSKAFGILGFPTCSIAVRLNLDHFQAESKGKLPCLDLAKPNERVMSWLMSLLVIQNVSKDDRKEMLHSPKQHLEPMLVSSSSLGLS